MKTTLLITAKGRWLSRALRLVLMVAGVAVYAAEKPNIVFILADDLASYELGCYGGRNVPTPNIDRLAGEGMRFTRAYASEPICTPCRSSLYTGLFPARHGASHNHGAARKNTLSVPHYLQPLGYRVGLAGKVHVSPRSVFPFENVPGFEANCVADTADYTLEGIRAFMKRDSQQPFCLFVCSTLPHGPYTVGDASAFPPDKLLLPPSWVDTPETRATFSAYCAEIAALDKQVGDVLKTLDETGAGANTLVFFGGEQGSQFPFAKWTLYDQGVNSAIIARWPGHIQGGKVSDAIVQYEDVLPTLIEVAGGMPPEKIDGRSFLPVLSGAKTSHRDYAFGIHNNTPTGPSYPIRSIRSGEYKLLLNLVCENEFSLKNEFTLKFNTNPKGNRLKYWGSWVEAAKQDAKAADTLKRFTKRPAIELYDVAKDPWEFTNLAEDPGHAQIRKDMEERLRAWMKEQGDPGAAADRTGPPQSHKAEE